jgi:hypothetical protein
MMGVCSNLTPSFFDRLIFNRNFNWPMILFLKQKPRNKQKSFAGWLGYLFIFIQNGITKEIRRRRPSPHFSLFFSLFFPLQTQKVKKDTILKKEEAIL